MVVSVAQVLSQLWSEAPLSKEEGCRKPMLDSLSMTRRCLAAAAWL